MAAVCKEDREIDLPYICEIGPSHSRIIGK